MNVSRLQDQIVEDLKSLDEYSLTMQDLLCSYTDDDATLRNIVEIVEELEFVVWKLKNYKNSIEDQLPSS